MPAASIVINDFSFSSAFITDFSRMCGFFFCSFSIFSFRLLSLYTVCINEIVQGRNYSYRVCALSDMAYSLLFHKYPYVHFYALLLIKLFITHTSPRIRYTRHTHTHVRMEYEKRRKEFRLLIDFNGDKFPLSSSFN